MPTALPARNIFDGTATPVTSTFKSTMGSLRDYLASLLGTTGAAVDARLALGADPSRRVQGLLGVNNTTTPNTKFDLSADAVVLRDATGATVTRLVTGAITCDLGLAGPSANGRDVAGAFSASTWINLFFVWNGTTLATIASTASPTTGPVLPSGYTHWAFATSVYWNASSNIPKVHARGSVVHMQDQQTVLTGGTAITLTAVSVTAFVPPGALSYKVIGAGNHAQGTSNAGNVLQLTLSLGVVSGLTKATQTWLQQNLGASLGNFFPIGQFELPNVGQQFYYAINATTGSGGAATLAVASFKVANGDC
jgi:hypothetical protein